ncbi:mCpol domain-containing protein [Microterricola pindariensis]|uniref:mCpol domain-containing protein n=1 Tax=Microterricola pindariensis TaxID=478010 RepID=UPI001374C00E|nr:mCpol domain-containing protein [Microterricola pindariensis]
MSLHSENGIYAYFDGDDVGANIELCLLEDNVGAASQISSRVSHAVQWLRGCLERDFSGEISFAAGDEVLAFLRKIPSKEQIDLLRSEFEKLSGLTISCGFGASARDAASRLRLAKLRGKDRSEGAPVG